VATIGLVFLEALKRGSRHSGKLIMKVRTYNAKAKGIKVGFKLDKTGTDDEEIAQRLLDAEDGKATRVMVGLLRLLEVKKYKIRIGFGVDGGVRTSSDESGFLIMNPLPSKELATAVPGQKTGLPENVSGLTADRIHLMYPPALGMGLSRELCPQTVQLEATERTKLRSRYEEQVAKLRQKDLAISSGPKITRIMSYSPTLYAADKVLQDRCANDLLNSNTFITRLPGVGDCASIRKAWDNLELFATHARNSIMTIKSYGGTWRVEGQFALEGKLEDFEKTLIAGVKSILAIARQSAVVVNAENVADNMEVALAALIALGKASLDVLSSSAHTNTVAECPIVWEYVVKSLARFFSGKDICYQQNSCIPRESVLIAGRPLFNPTWESTYDMLLNVQGNFFFQKNVGNLTITHYPNPNYVRPL
jgi:hypothetical protein